MQESFSWYFPPKICFADHQTAVKHENLFYVLHCHCTTLSNIQQPDKISKNAWSEQAFCTNGQMIYYFRLYNCNETRSLQHTCFRISSHFPEILKLQTNEIPAFSLLKWAIIPVLCKGMLFQAPCTITPYMSPAF